MFLLQLMELLHVHTLLHVNTTHAGPVQHAASTFLASLPIPLGSGAFSVGGSCTQKKTD
jgi:hypothetical protein